VRVFVAPVNDKVRKEAGRIAQQLRKEGLIAETDLAGRKLGKQLQWAASQDFKLVAIFGPEEAKKKSVKLRDMKSGKERTVKIAALAKEVQKRG